MNVKFYLSDVHACGIVRGEVPARAINQTRSDCRVDCKSDVLCSDFFKTDLMVFQRSHHPSIYQKMLAAKSMGIKTVYEIDDDMLNMPGDFDEPYKFYKKPEVRETMLKFLRNVDAVTVSTGTLGESIRKLTPRPSFVVENAIDLDRWRDAQLARDVRLSTDPSDTVTIGWMASGSHLIDIPLVDRALCDILQAHSNVRLMFIGNLTLAHLVKYGLAKYGDRMTFLPWTEINELPFQMAKFDITIAPLVDCPFNACKSPLKWMQANALGIPGVYSDLPLYRDICTNGADGFLALPGQWKEPLEALVKDAKLRKRISVSGLQKVQQWDILKTAGNWVAAWRQIMSIWV